MRYAKELKIGLFVVIVMFASFFLINYLRGEDILNREYEVISRYDNVDGLVASAPVYIKGYKAGKVAEVIYSPETEDFQVVCSIRNEFKVPQDSKMTIYGVDIMGTKGVKIDLGTAGQYVEDGGILSPMKEPSLIDGLAGEIGPLLSSVSALIDSLGLTVSGLNKIMTEQNALKVSDIIENLDKTITGLQALVSSVGGRSEELETFITNLSAVSENLSVIMSKAHTTVDGVNEMIATVNKAEIDELVSSIKVLLENINDPDGSVSKLLTDDSVYDSADALLKDIDDLVKKIQENPKKYLKISVF